MRCARKPTAPRRVRLHDAHVPDGLERRVDRVPAVPRHAYPARPTHCAGTRRSGRHTSLANGFRWPHPLGNRRALSAMGLLGSHGAGAFGARSMSAPSARANAAAVHATRAHVAAHHTLDTGAATGCTCICTCTGSCITASRASRRSHLIARVPLSVIIYSATLPVPPAAAQRRHSPALHTTYISVHISLVASCT